MFMLHSQSYNAGDCALSRARYFVCLCCLPNAIFQNWSCVFSLSLFLFLTHSLTSSLTNSLPLASFYVFYFIFNINFISVFRANFGKEARAQQHMSIICSISDREQTTTTATTTAATATATATTTPTKLENMAKIKRRRIERERVQEQNCLYF